MTMIVLQNGHKNVGENPDPLLRSMTGAPGEEAWIEQVYQALGPRLVAQGFAVRVIDGSGPGQDYAGDCFVALHYDGGPPEASYCMAARDAQDENPAGSDRLLATWRSIYPEAVAILADESRVTTNMTEYFAWRYVPGPEPDIICECGNGANAHDAAILHGRMEVIVEAWTRVLTSYFGVTYRPPQTSGGPAPVSAEIVARARAHVAAAESELAAAEQLLEA